MCQNNVFIIAEAGVNHNGDMAIARALIDAAKDAGADAIKFQSFKSSLSIAKTAVKAEYQNLSTDPSESQLEMVQKLELSEENHLELLSHCKKVGIKFFSTAFDKPSIDLLEKLNVADIVKIPSGEITNIPYIRYLCRKKKKIYLSTGMSTLGDIEIAIEAIERLGTPRDMITVLHCTTEYPTPMGDVNLLAMVNIGKALGVKVGYSDHTQGIEVPIAAVALGATVIEKHFTLDRNLPGPDHLASLEPFELKEMVKSVRNIEKALGDGIKRPSPSELKNKSIIRKSIVAARSIKSGELFSEENLIAKRPGTGISPLLWDTLIGQPSPRDFSEDELIEL